MIYLFCQKCGKELNIIRFCRLWKPGTILVGSKECPECEWERIKSLSKSGFLFTY